MADTFRLLISLDIVFVRVRVQKLDCALNYITRFDYNRHKHRNDANFQSDNLTKKKKIY